MQAIGIRVDVPQVFVGMLIGGALPWLFSSFAIQAVSRAASPDRAWKSAASSSWACWRARSSPTTGRRSRISTTAAQKELVSLALLGVVTPDRRRAWCFKVEALGGFLAGIIVSGQLLAVFMNNAGGAWDNAKKLIEDEPKDIDEEYRQGLRAAQGRRGRRHGRRSVQGHRRPGAQPDDQGREPGLGDHRADHRAVCRATGVTLLGVWIVALALLGVLAWAVMRSKAPAPSMSA